MILCDVNVLIYAHREESAEHLRYAAYLRDLANGDAAFGVSDAVLSGFVRIVTNPRIFREPTPLSLALAFSENLRSRPQAVHLVPGPRNWLIFCRLCEALPATGKLVADAWHAALAIEHGCEWISTDSDFSRFPGLKWRHPLRG
ncbi:MAG: type II toxin-antitoxin system VapC family toxin [Opitutales bacterium]|nr:type II toxin-antitoxin system VapC family toxin [Opitutales bacterium]